MAETAQEAAQVLEDAADLLLIRGRAVGCGHGGNGGPLCVNEAITYVANGEARGMPIPLDAPGLAALERHLFRQGAVDRFAAEDRLRDLCISRGYFPAWIWNDRLTSEDDDFEVIDTLRLVAKDLRNAAVAS